MILTMFLATKSQNNWKFGFGKLNYVRDSDAFTW